MKLVQKLYVQDDITCDTTNTRKTFFPVMCEGKHIADIEKERKSYGMTYVEQVLRFTIKADLKADTIRSVFKIFSDVLCDNLEHIDTFTLKEIDHFSKYRTKVIDKDYGVVTRNNENSITNLSPHTKSALRGAFVFLNYNEKPLFIGMKKAKELLHVDDTVFTKNHKTSRLCASYFPITIIDPEHKITYNAGTQKQFTIYINHADDLKNTHIKFHKFDHNQDVLIGITMSEDLFHALENKEQSLTLPSVVFDESLEHELKNVHFIASIADTVRRPYVENGKLTYKKINIDYETSALKQDDLVRYYGDQDDIIPKSPTLSLE